MIIGKFKYAFGLYSLGIVHSAVVIGVSDGNRMLNTIVTIPLSALYIPMNVPSVAELSRVAVKVVALPLIVDVMPYSARIAVRAVCTTLGIEVLWRTHLMMCYAVGLVLFRYH